MGFLNKLFSPRNRAALAAEAAGDFELAAQRYASAGHYESAVRMHVARANRANSRSAEIEALRDAMHWAREEKDQHSTWIALGKALLAQAQAEGITTERDRERVREAAQLLLKASCFEHAGDAYVSLEDDQAAAAAYKSGGLVTKMERALLREQKTQDRDRAERSAFADYDFHMRSGARDAALDALRTCLLNANSQSQYRRLLNELESRLITNGRVLLKGRGGQVLLCSAKPEIRIGRAPTSDLALRAGGVSRHHSSVFVTHRENTTSFELGDAGSRNGTRIGESKIVDRLQINDAGTFRLGDQTEICYTTSTPSANHNQKILRLDVLNGIDQGISLLLSREGTPMSLEPLGLSAAICFQQGRPFLQYSGDDLLTLDGAALNASEIQLIHGDSIIIRGIEIEVG